MAIGSAAQKQEYNVFVYDEKGNVLFQKTGKLVGYTSSTVTVYFQNTTYTFDVKGNVLFTK
ncbi:MAG: hypothetical protein ACLQF0_08700 [Dissulfurispiraceae bacterium]